MKYLIQLLAALFSFTALAQPAALWDHLMDSKDLRCMSKEQRMRTGESFDTLYLRTVCKDYYEGLFEFRDNHPNQVKGALDSFREVYLQVITKQGHIVYCALNAVPRQQPDDADQLVRLNLVSYRDVHLFPKLQEAFRGEYGAELDLGDMFDPDIQFGHCCGFGCGVPEAREMMDTVIEQRDRRALVAWLQSSCTEKQLYAFDACHELKLQGIPLTDREMALCKKIAKRSGTVNGCAGCFYSPVMIRNIVGQIDRKPRTGFLGRFVFDPESEWWPEDE